MFADRLKQLRIDSDLSQEELAKIIGVKQQTIGGWETGRTEPDHQITCRLADFFNVTVDELLGRTPIDKKTLHRIGDDLFPKLLSQIEQMDIPLEIKQAALKKFNSLTKQEKYDMLPKLVKSAIVEEGKVKYEIDSSFDDEVIQKYKSLSEQDRKAVAAIIDSLANKQKS